LKTKIAFISELQNDVEQLQIVEDDNNKLKSEISTKESDLRQWTVKVINQPISYFCILTSLQILHIHKVIHLITEHYLFKFHYISVFQFRVQIIRPTKRPFIRNQFVK